MSRKIHVPKTVVGFFWSYLRPHRSKLLVMLVLITLFTLVSSLIPYALKMIIDGVSEAQGSKEEIFVLLGWPIAAYVLLNIATEAFVLLYEWIHMNMIPPIKAEMRSEMLKSSMDHSYRFFQDQLAGNLSNKIMDMVRGFDSITLCLFNIFLPITLYFLFVTAILWSVHWSLGAFVAFWFIMYNGVLFILGKRCLAFSDDHSEANSDLSGKIVDLFRNMTTVRMFARSRFETSYFETFQIKEVKKSLKLQRFMCFTHIFQGLTSVVLMITMILLALYGWQQGWTTVGDFTLVAQSSFSIMIFCWWMGSQLPLFFKEMGTSQQALTFLNTPYEFTDSPDAKPLQVTSGEISFKDVHFHYLPNNPIFSGLNLKISPGEKIGLVGFSGSGKTTFVNLIQRYFNLQSGEISIDGQNIEQVTQNSLRSHIAMIPQDPALFHRSLMENIRYGKIYATDEEVIEVSKLAHCHEFVTEMELGYQSTVGEGGIKLSGGQRQRIAIARALLKDAPILILDEATSALDSVTERKIQESLDRLMKEKTTIVVAHRLSTLLHLDRILVFKDGSIVESGTHKELLAKEGHYAHLWNMQNHGFLPFKEQLNNSNI